MMKGETVIRQAEAGKLPEVSQGLLGLFSAPRELSNT